MKKRNEKSKQAIEGTVIPATARPPRLATIRDIRREMAKVYSDARIGAISPGDGTRLCYILSAIITAIHGDELEQRVKLLEENHETERKNF